MAKRAPRSRPNLASLSSRELEAELRRRERGIEALRRRHERLLETLAELEEQIRSEGGEIGAVSRAGRGGRQARAGGRRRPRNESNLIDALAAVLKGATMSVTEVAQAVQRAGYKTTSENFRTIVNQALIKSDKFKKVARGQYTAK